MSPDAPACPRFSWPMRLFLGLILFWMIFRCMMVMVPWEKWGRELAVREGPVHGLPTPDRPREELFLAFDSAWEYARPWPDRESRKRLHGWSDGGRFAVAWLSSRLSSLETVFGAAQGWSMFTPGASIRRIMVRSRLHFADGSTWELRSAGEPEDLTCFGPSLRYTEMCLGCVPGKDRENGNRGWCNLLRHRHPRNEAGSPLVRIVLYHITIFFPPPGEDATEFLREQSRLTQPGGEQTSPPFFVYDVPDRD